MMICFLKRGKQKQVYLGFLNVRQKEAPQIKNAWLLKSNQIERDDGAMTSGYIPHQVIFPIVVDPFFCGEIYRFAT